jgi:hypothetical protein
MSSSAVRSESHVFDTTTSSSCGRALLEPAGRRRSITTNDCNSDSRLSSTSYNQTDRGGSDLGLWRAIWTFLPSFEATALLQALHQTPGIDSLEKTQIYGRRSSSAPARRDSTDLRAQRTKHNIKTPAWLRTARNL